MTATEVRYIKRMEVVATGDESNKLKDCTAMRLCGYFV